MGNEKSEEDEKSIWKLREKVGELTIEWFFLRMPASVYA